MGVNAVNSYIPATMPKAVSPNTVPASLVQENKMSDSTKALIGLGVLGSVAAGSLLVNKHYNTKAANEIKELAEKLLKKPETFDLQSVKDIAGGFAKDGLLKSGDSLVFMPKNMLMELVEKSPTSKWSKIIKAMNLSDKGFSVVVRSSDKQILNDTMRYFEPQQILFKDMSDAFKNGEMFVTNIN